MVFSSYYFDGNVVSTGNSPLLGAWDGMNGNASAQAHVYFNVHKMSFEYSSKQLIEITQMYTGCDETVFNS